MPTGAEVKAAEAVIRQQISGILKFEKRAVTFTIMDGIEDVARAALEAAERVREKRHKELTDATLKVFGFRGDQND